MRVAVIDKDRRQVILVEQLLLVVAEDDQRVEFGAAHALLQALDRRLCLVVARSEALGASIAAALSGRRDPATRRRWPGRLPCREARTPSQSIKLGQSLAGVFSVGVCEVAIPRTILAMTDLLAVLEVVAVRIGQWKGSIRPTKRGRTIAFLSTGSPL